jgi:hypothetical protein
MLLNHLGGRSAVCALLVLAGSAPARADTVVLTSDATYTQNFDTLAASGTSGTVPTGVQFVETGANANSTYTAGTGSSNTGNTYSFGASGSTDRALGGLRSGNLIPQFGLAFTNDTGRTITDLTIGFTGEQYRLGFAGRADRLDFEYAIGTDTISSGTFVGFDALDFASPSTTGAGAKDGNAAAFRTVKLATISGLTIADGQSFAIRFSDFNAADADDGLAIDDFSLAVALAPVAVPEPASWAMMIGGFALAGASVRRRSGVRVLA